MVKQMELHAGLFACDSHVIISNTTADKLFADTQVASRMPVSVINGSLWVPLSRGPHGHLHALNTPVFQAAWELIFKDGAYKRFDWTLKLDVDAVIIAPRVRLLLRDRPRRDGKYEPMYLLNAGQDALGNLLHGPVEVLSSAAMAIFENGAQRCRNEVDRTKEGEDWYLNMCLQLLKVPGVQELRLLQDAYMWGKTHVDCNSDHAVFHPVKSTGEWVACVQQIGQPAVAVSLAMISDLDRSTSFDGQQKPSGIESLVVLAFIAGFVILALRVCSKNRRNLLELESRDHSNGESDGLLGHLDHLDGPLQA